jgi:epoxyqueuosine reductase
MPHSLPHELSALVKRLAIDAGFDLVGIARAEMSAYGEAYRQWIAAGKHGEMHYLAKDVEERVDLTKKLPWAKSVICVGLAYWQNKNETDSDSQIGKIARYAWGRDYHKVMDAKLREVEKCLRAALGEEAGVVARSYVDTGPILEREFAARAGLGWVGKNTLLIHPYEGSWFLLGELVVNLEMMPDSPIQDHCGTCTRCIEACPTNAITPYSVDGAKCISYLTLEHRGEIDEQYHAPMREAGFAVGCDICQEVCPFNRRPLATSEPEFAAKVPAPAIGLAEILRWQEQEWDAMTRGRAFRRAKFEMWKRNAAILANAL